MQVYHVSNNDSLPIETFVLSEQISDLFNEVRKIPVKIFLIFPKNFFVVVMITTDGNDWSRVLSFVIKCKRSTIVGVLVRCYFKQIKWLLTLLKYKILYQTREVEDRVIWSRCVCRFWKVLKKQYGHEWYPWSSNVFWL